MRFTLLLLCVTLFNLCFAGEIKLLDSIPRGWQTLPTKDPDVEIGIDTLIKHGGKASAFLYRAESDDAGTAGLAQYIEATPYLGKRVRWSVYAKSKDIQRATFFMRVDGKETSLTFANANKNPVEETSDWRVYQVTLDVPEESVKIVFGTVLVNRGMLWIDDCTLEIVDKTVPSDDILTEQQKTVKFSPKPYLPNKTVMNLGFEEH